MNEEAKKPRLNTHQILIELCCLSYCDDKADHFESRSTQEAKIAADITNGLSQLDLNGWPITWGPVLSDDLERTFMMYVAAHSHLNEYAVVIRGTDPSSIEGWLTDGDVTLVAPPYGSGLSIAKGAYDAIEKLNAMTSGSQTLAQYLSSLPGSPAIYVTGHSFGGTLATAYAPWLVAQGVASPQVVTFASPSAGNAAFVTYLTANVQSVTSYINTLDIVPNFWASILNVEQYYASPGPACPIDGLLKYWAKKIVGYEQAGVQVSRTGTLQSHDDWFAEVGYQHDHNTYATLLGAPALSIDNSTSQAGVATLPRERPHRPAPLS